MTKQSEDSAFLQARRALLLDHCFFGSLIMHLKEQADSDAQQGIWTDGQSIGYNAAALEALPLSQRAGLLAKGVLQCALGHHLRRGVRDPKRWNEASDYVVNPEILDSNLPLPEGALVDRQYQGKSVEQVYAALEAAEQQQQQQQKQGNGNDDKQQQSGGQSQSQQQQGQGNGQSQKQQQGQGSGSGQQPQTGEIRDLPGDEPGQAAGEAEKSERERDWKITMQQALQNSLSRGDLPGNFKSMIEKALAPKVSWKDELRRFMQSLAFDETSWAKPNRRFMCQGITLPSVTAQRMGTMVVANDTSGSTAHAQQAFLGEMQAIVEDTNPKQTLYLQCDTRITAEHELEPGDEFPVAIAGYGGTDLRKVFEHVEQLGIEPACMVFLTDLETPFPNEEPPYPVLWVCVNERGTAPFGDVIYIDPTQ